MEFPPQMKGHFEQRSLGSLGLPGSLMLCAHCVPSFWRTSPFPLCMTSQLLSILKPTYVTGSVLSHPVPLPFYPFPSLSLSFTFGCSASPATWKLPLWLKPVEVLKKYGHTVSIITSFLCYKSLKTTRLVDILFLFLVKLLTEILSDHHAAFILNPSKRKILCERTLTWKTKINS